jgi:hypothetical protein
MTTRRLDNWNLIPGRSTDLCALPYVHSACGPPISLCCIHAEAVDSSHGPQRSAQFVLAHTLLGIRKKFHTHIKYKKNCTFALLDM